MKTENLTAENLKGLNPELIKYVESILGKEIESAYTYKDGFNSSFRIGKGISSIFARNFTPFNKENQIVSYDEVLCEITVIGRNKYERTYTTKKYSVEKVGFKLKTMNYPMCWIYGNPKEITTEPFHVEQ